MSVPVANVGAGNAEVAEFQGLYGTYHVSETLLQKVWLRREFDLSRARLTTGEPLRVLHPGQWNRLAGPDFHAARFAIGDEIITGDVEVHFHAEAWMQHGHHEDRAYDDVVLHVVLFPPPPGARPARTRAGRELRVLVLVDLLWHDLEEYASDDAVAALSGRDAFPLLEELLALPAPERQRRVQAAASRRWQEKVHFAQRRLERVGWEEACHLTTLEILGYRSNRVTMMRVGERYPWSAWRQAAPALEEIVAEAAEWWTLRGVRPANQPRLRLAHYHAWMHAVPDWPTRMRAWEAPELSARNGPRAAASLRRGVDFPRRRETIRQELCAGELGGTRLDTWIVNLLLPMRAAVSPSPDWEALWHAWYPGDAPESLLSAVRQLSSPGAAILRTNGIVQGLLGLQLARVRQAGGLNA